MNSPVGTAEGINAGRVVWVHNADATSWDGSAGNWWDDRNTDQKTVDARVSAAITGLTDVDFVLSPGEVEIGNSNLTLRSAGLRSTVEVSCFATGVKTHQRACGWRGSLRIIQAVRRH